MQELINLYEGNEEYVFVSYSHKDKERVLPLVHKLAEKGYRIWYDQGIHPGTEWPEVVAERLRECTVFMVFLSENYSKSKNCIREIHYAVAKEKDFLSVILEPVTLSAGVEMQLCVSQAVDCRKYKTEEKVFEAILDADVLEPCKIEEEAVVEEEPAEEVPPQKEKSQRQKKQREKKAKKKPGFNKKKAGLVFGALVLAGVGFAAVSFGVKKANEVTIKDQVVSKDTSSLWFKDESFVKADLKVLYEFSDIYSLHFENCTLDNGALEVISQIEDLNSLSLISCDGVEDWSFVDGVCDSLYSLELVDMQLTDEQWNEQLVFEHLSSLIISGNPDFTDVSWMNQSMPMLSSVVLSNNGIADADVFSEYEGLHELCLNGNAITSMRVPLKSLRMTEINLSDNPLTSIAALSDLTVLQKVALKGALANLESFDGIECVNKSANTLTYLDLSENGLGQEQLESIIGEGTLFEKLYLDGNELKDLSFLADKGNNLEIFSAARCKLKDVSGMGQMVNLYTINLSDNQIESLENFPVLITTSNYVRLDLRNNKLTTLDPLEGCSQVDFSRLYVNGNPLQAEGMNAVSSLEGNIITFDYIEGMDLQILEPFGSKYIAKVPMDQRVVYEDAIYSCFFGTLDEYDQLIED